MRIITGRAGRRRIEVPRQVTRPTTERVREALFSIIGSHIEQTKVLDLFAGSGALGLEALSRGAASADFVETDRGACSVIEKNLRRSELEGGRVVCRDALAFAGGAGKARYDWIFADPPYVKFAWDRDLAADLLVSGLEALVGDGGRVVLEVASDRIPTSNWVELERRRYGASTVLFLEPHRGGEKEI